MLKHRFMPYIILGCVLVLFGVAYLSYVNYQADQNHKEWVAEMTALQGSIEGRHDHSSRPHVHHGEEESGAVRIETPEHQKGTTAFVGMTAEDQYSYDIAGRRYISDQPMSQRDIDVNKYFLTGEMTPLVEQAIRDAQDDTLRGPDGQVIEAEMNMVVQTVLGPDGQLHQVISSRYQQYEEGDAILKSEINSPLLKMAATSDSRTPRRRILTDDGEVHHLPAEYYAIEDPYEQEEYFKKFDQSIQLGTSIAGIEKMITAGKLDLSLTETEKETVDQQLAIYERRRPFLPKTLPLLDKPPVKVSFLPDDDPYDVPGWRRKSGVIYGPSGEVIYRAAGNGEAVSDGNYSEADTFSGRSINEDAPPVRSDVPVSPSDLPDIVKPISPQSAADIEKQSTPARIEAELGEGLSPDRFDKVQQLIDQYGTEEGLSRLREMDPDAARQFERGHPPQSPREQGEGTRTVPDGGQSEPGSKD